MAAHVASDRGESLLELLIAMLLMGIAVVVLLGGLGTSIRISDIHRKQAIASADVRAFAEAVQGAVAASPTSYLECAPPSQYESAYRTGDAAFDRKVVTVRYWDVGAFAFGDTCTASTDSGVQQVSLLVRSVDDAASETLDIIIRRPCRPADTFPLDLPCG